MNNKRGVFVISLDFELFWGVADLADYSLWKEKIDKVYEIVPKTLALFEKYGIHATWATVAGIMTDGPAELYRYFPEKYRNKREGLLINFISMRTITAFRILCFLEGV